MLSLIDEKKGENITCIDIQNITTIAKYLIIVTGNSQTHSSSLAGHVIDFFYLQELQELLFKKDPNTANPWILIDASDYLINIFQKETREFYALEKLYFKGNIIYQS